MRVVTSNRNWPRAPRRSLTFFDGGADVCAVAKTLTELKQGIGQRCNANMPAGRRPFSIVCCTPRVRALYRVGRQRRINVRNKWGEAVGAGRQFRIALGVALITLGSAARAAGLTGMCIQAEWDDPNASTVIASQTVVDGVGVEIACPGVGSFCSAWGSTTMSDDFGANSISFNAPNGTGHAAAVFDGYTFSDLPPILLGRFAQGVRLQP
jgi:hypothetical protein